MNTYRTLARFFRKLKDDYKYAYKALWTKTFYPDKNYPIPIKQGILLNAGDRTYGELVMRLCIYSGIMGFLCGMSVALLATIFGSWLYIVPLFAASLLPVLWYQTLNYRLGLLGEHTVGEELDKIGRLPNETKIPEWRVFHAFSIIRGKGDIDHIIVCAKGVFCVETKTMRKYPGDRTLTIRDKKIYRGNKELKKILFPKQKAMQRNCTLFCLSRSVITVNL